VTVVAGPEYAVGATHERLLGEIYRDLWTTPVRVPVLNIDTFAGGITPVRRGGGKQTISLRFEANDGREFNFRSVNKQITQGLPEWLQETAVDWIVQDQTSSLHPAAAGIVSGLLDAVGVLNPGPRLVVMPDDPALGEFRELFAGVLGWIETHANEDRDDPEQGFAGAVRVAGGDRLIEHLDEDPENRVDSRAYLTARLMDILIADWDRHEGQYRWVRYDRGDTRWWVPVPEDRDYAFANYDGLLVGIASSTFVPRAADFEPEIRDNLLPLLINSDDMDRRLLSALPRQAWDSVAVFIQSRLTDTAIDAALRVMPEPWYRISGPGLLATLVSRRAELLEAAGRFYDLVMQEPEVHGTDEEDLAEVTRLADGRVRVQLWPLDDDGEPDGDAYFDAAFSPDPTREIRIFLRGGDDRLTIRGDVPGSIRVRAVGGEGDDILVDSSSVASVKTKAVFHDAEGDNSFVRGRTTTVITRPHVVEEAERNVFALPTRDWGSSKSWFSPAYDYSGRVGGLVIGGGPSYTRYGFRHDPYRYRIAARAMVAPGTWRAGVEASGDFRRASTDTRITMRAHATQLNSFYFHGFGNQTVEGNDHDTLIHTDEILFEALYHLPLGTRVEVAFGPEIRYVDAAIQPTTLPDARAGGFTPRRFGQTGALSRLSADTRDDTDFPTRGLRLRIGGDFYPAVWDAAEPFASISTDASSYIPLPAGSVLALRAGGEQVLGPFPAHESAFLGGSATLRGFSHQRYAGDAMMYGGSELRVALIEANLLVRGTVGGSLFTDVGRVFYEGESDGGWHQGVGGTIWFATPGPVVHLSYAHGEHDRVYVGLGMPF
jgi:hypothetical protein